LGETLSKAKRSLTARLSALPLLSVTAPFEHDAQCVLNMTRNASSVGMAIAREEWIFFHSREARV
jgi:hypothetical protein